LRGGRLKSMLETGDLGGKCADLNALFVVSRALPAFRRATSTACGWQSRNTAIKPGCGYRETSQRANTAVRVLTLPATAGSGRSADVRKVMLEEEKGGLPITDEKVKIGREACSAPGK